SVSPFVGGDKWANGIGARHNNFATVTLASSAYNRDILANTAVQMEAQLGAHLRPPIQFHDDELKFNKADTMLPEANTTVPAELLCCLSALYS
ncbi:MAG: hypothetical protein WCL71_13840, partial [Deltaproteobacteria bacterium]